ncbi:hypothetical protein NDU88_007692 [Pleurodeles waltl]|uniref:Uncharacterized protein n=1 Tax=Pleurodeles waltl TaxID=8319 RepID=A0AAV7ST82_PLEWA|nr:hypothetical protein NDU88_007692 [Pleurodeles waltl]
MWPFSVVDFSPGAAAVDTCGWVWSCGSGCGAGLGALTLGFLLQASTGRDRRIRVRTCVDQRNDACPAFSLNPLAPDAVMVHGGTLITKKDASRYLFSSTAGYDDQAEELYYLDDTAGSFDQDLVYALDAGVRHSGNQALAQAIQPIKHHLLGLVDQQGWVAPVGAQPIGESSFAASTQAAKQTSNPHAADFESLIRNMAREHDYNAGSQKKAVSDPASSSSSSEHSSEQGDVPSRKRKKKAHHQEVPTPKALPLPFPDIENPLQGGKVWTVKSK